MREFNWDACTIRVIRVYCEKSRFFEWSNFFGGVLLQDRQQVRQAGSSKFWDKVGQVRDGSSGKVQVVEPKTTECWQNSSQKSSEVPSLRRRHWPKLNSFFIPKQLLRIPNPYFAPNQRFFHQKFEDKVQILKVFPPKIEVPAVGSNNLSKNPQTRCVLHYFLLNLLWLSSHENV